jgi:hypothetical protein
MADLPAPGKARSPKGDSSDVRQQLLTMLKETGELRAGGAFSAAEHEQLQAILLGALRRLDGARRNLPDDEILDAVVVDANPNDPDVLDATDLFFKDKHDTDVLDAVELEGDQGGDILDALDLPDDTLDALDLGNVDDADALDAETIADFAQGEGFATGLPLGVAEDVQELDLAGFTEDAQVLDLDSE